MALSGSSTLAEVWSEFRDNADYDAQTPRSAGVVKARAFVVACRYLLLEPKRMSHGGNNAESIEYDPGQVRGMLDDARRFLDRYDTEATPAVVVHGFEDFRGQGVADPAGGC